MIGSHQQKSESKWLSPIGISTGATAGKNHVGFTNNTAGLLSEMRFFPRLLFTENPHSLPSRWSSSTQPSKCGIFGTHFDRNSEQLDSHTPLSDYRREAGLLKTMLRSSFYSPRFRPKSRPLLCLTRAPRKIFPREIFSKNSAPRNRFGRKPLMNCVKMRRRQRKTKDAFSIFAPYTLFPT